MFNNKKAISSYIIVLLLFSVLMTIILFPILGTIYADDNINCQKVKYETPDMCRRSGFLIFQFVNTGEIDFVGDFTHSYSESHELKMGEDKKLKIYVDKSDVKLLPIVSDGFNKFECSSKEEKIKMELVPLC